MISLLQLEMLIGVTGDSRRPHFEASQNQDACEHMSEQNTAFRLAFLRFSPVALIVER